MTNMNRLIAATLFALGFMTTSANADIIVNGTTLNFSDFESHNTVSVINGGTLNLTGGALTVPVQSPNNNNVHFNLNGGSLLNFSGGVHTINERIQTVGATSTIRITGSAATINVHQQSAFNANMDFVFDAAGISTFDSDSRLGFGSSTVTIDASAYTGPSASFVLVDTDLFGGTYANNGGGFGTVGTITAPTGFTATYDQSLFDGAPADGFNGQITLTLTAVPEPSSFAFLGIASVGLIGYRRRNRKHRS